MMIDYCTVLRSVYLGVLLLLPMKKRMEDERQLSGEHHKLDQSIQKRKLESGGNGDGGPLRRARERPVNSLGAVDNVACKCWQSQKQSRRDDACCLNTCNAM